MPDLTRDEIECLQRGNAPDSTVGALCTMALRAIDAEAELAAAREAMPSADEVTRLRRALRNVYVSGKHHREVEHPLDRLDAFRAAHPTNSETTPVRVGLNNGVPPSRGDIGGPSGRCEICDWPYSTSRKKGCVPGDCSYRPPHGSTEALRIAARRRELAAARPTPSGEHLPLPPMRDQPLTEAQWDALCAEHGIEDTPSVDQGGDHG